MLALVIRIGVANFFLFILGAIFLGGDALSGRAENGHYFVSSHGALTEVSAFAWAYSLVHLCSNFATFPASLVASLIALFRGRDQWGNRGRGAV
jgi:hypothetical protein